MTAQVCFVDSSAVTKLVIAEAESTALRERLSEAELVGSALVIPEVTRAVRRTGAPETEEVLAQVLSRISVVPVSGAVLSRASELEPWSLRTLDAIHLAAALSVTGQLGAFIAYDERLVAAALQHGLPVERPGAR